MRLAFSSLPEDNFSFNLTLFQLKSCYLEHNCISLALRVHFHWRCINPTCKCHNVLSGWLAVLLTAEFGYTTMQSEQRDYYLFPHNSCFPLALSCQKLNIGNEIKYVAVYTKISYCQGHLFASSVVISSLKPDKKRITLQQAMSFLFFSTKPQEKSSPGTFHIEQV